MHAIYLDHTSCVQDIWEEEAHTGLLEDGKLEPTEDIATAHINSQQLCFLPRRSAHDYMSKILVSFNSTYSTISEERAHKNNYVFVTPASSFPASSQWNYCGQRI